jgi:NTE family protein
MKKIGLALGGGGAKGFAHIPMLEVFDELGIQPDVISGTSAGAIIGSMYASGMKGVEIREWLDEMLIDKGDSIRDLFNKPKALKSIEFLDFSFNQFGLLKGRRFTAKMQERMDVADFEDLNIKLRVVAADYWKSKQIVLKSGELFPAIRASMSLPGVFVPAELEGKILVDGGGVNPVPHDVLTDCDVVIAIDVMGFPAIEQPKVPGMFSSMIEMYNIMQNSIIKQRLKACPPNLYIKPNIQGIDIFDFHRSEEVYEMADPAARELEKFLTKLMEVW